MEGRATGRFGDTVQAPSRRRFGKLWVDRDGAGRQGRITGPWGCGWHERHLDYALSESPPFNAVADIRSRPGV